MLNIGMLHAAAETWPVAAVTPARAVPTERTRRQGVLEKRGKDTFGPPPGRRLLLWLDDMNLPAQDAYGTQQPLALLRQLLGRQARRMPCCSMHEHHKDGQVCRKSQRRARRTPCGAARSPL